MNAKSETSSDAQRLCAFFESTLELWRVSGSVNPGDAPIAAIVRSDAGATVWIERDTAAQTPFRWSVRWRVAGEAPGGARELRPRACGSLVGVLSALRAALGVDRGTPVRIAATPPRV